VIQRNRGGLGLGENGSVVKKKPLALRGGRSQLRPYNSKRGFANERTKVLAEIRNGEKSLH